MARSTEPSPLALAIDPAALRQLVQAVVAETLAAVEADRAKLDAAGERLAWSEPEAAALLGLNPHQLRDARLEGNITASVITGRRIRYTREDLLRYLATERTTGRRPT